jgi:hypothetical protein
VLSYGISGVDENEELKKTVKALVVALKACGKEV